MKANSDKSKQSSKATHRVLAGVLCGASVLSLVLSLVMPPISQAIANDAQPVSTEETVMGGGSSSESTDVDNTTNGDTENQNSDDAEGDETGDDAQPEGQSEDALQAEDNIAPTVETVAAVVENEQTEAAVGEIANAGELHDKLQSVQAGQTASFTLTADIDYADEITLNKSDSKITLNLSDHKITHSGNNSNKPLFSVSNRAEFTITDSDPDDKVTGTQQLQNQGQDLVRENYGKKGEVVHDKDGIPTELTYYVTKSSASGTGTTESLETHKVKIKGAIVSTAPQGSTLKLINIYAGGKFNLQRGVLTQKENCNVGNLIYAENGSTVNMSGGYVCGASKGTDGAGIKVTNYYGTASTLNLTGGVIAGNYAPNGGGVYAIGSTINMTNGTISGNGTFEDQPGYGAGICALGSDVTVSGGYITNNNNQYNYEVKNGANHKGNGCHGGGGIAAYNGGSLQISGGCITGNYSAEAGGGVYAGNWTQPLDKFKVCGGIIASNVAELSEGGGIRIAAPTLGEFEVPKGSHAYITNNTTNTTNDWGGGGVFVQGGNSGDNVNSASLKIYNALITNNDAEGFGGGFAACPSGKTAITDTKGIAIYDNTDHDGKNRSGGSNGKSEDWNFNEKDDKGGEITPAFIAAGHEDLFLIHDSANSETNPYIAAVTGQMLGGGAANWSGTIDKTTPTSIGKYEGAQAKYMIGLKSEPIQEDKDAATAAATLYITGNKSNIHGGGIMTNGDVVAGSTQEVKVYPKMKLNGSKVFEDGTLKGNDFDFQLLKQNKIIDEQGGITYTVPSFDSNGDLQLNRCSVVDTVKNDENGNLTFDLGEVYADDDLVYYLVEVPGTDKDKGVTYDKTIYKIDPEVVKDEGKSHNVLDIKYTYYKVKSVSVTKVKNDGAGARTPETEPAAVTEAEGENAVIVALTSGATFTNKYTPYTSSGSWTPKATKVVEGGEMKEFTLEFADNDKFDKAEAVKTKANDKNSQLLSFNPIEYKLDQLNKLETDPTGRGASKTFTYFVREQQPTTPFTNYKYDRSVYQITVNATDDSNHHIDVTATYKQIQDRDGNLVTNGTTYDLTDTSTPTFTNTYSTSLPLSGMSGVTLTYLAGAAVLCAAAAWMHIRRKANAKGGKRRE